MLLDELRLEIMLDDHLVKSSVFLDYRKSLLIQCERIVRNTRNYSPLCMRKVLSKSVGPVDLKQHIRLACLPPMGKQHFAEVK